MQSELSNSQIYDELIRLIGEVRLQVKNLKDFYRKNKKESNNLGQLSDQWQNTKDQVTNSLRNLQEFFDRSDVLHSDVKWTIPRDIIKYLDEQESLDSYLEQQLEEVNRAMERMKIITQNFSMFGSYLREAYNSNGVQ